MIVVLTRGAEADLEDIGDFIAEDNPQRAITFVDELVDRCRSLADQPKRFALVPGLSDRGIRRCPFKEYLIFYRISGVQIDILHILHGARDYERILFPDP